MRISDWSSDVCSSDLDVDLKIADGDRIAIDQPAVGFEGFADHAESRAIIGKGLDPEAVVLVRPLDRHAQLLREHPRLPAMVHMAMGDEDLLDLDPEIGRASCRERVGQYV